MLKLTSPAVRLFFVCALVAQQPNLDSPEPTSKVPPVYPPIAKAAHVSGVVVLELTIDTSGHVASAKTISGPPMLLGAAIDAVKQWVYKPFLVDGVAHKKVARAYINFTLQVPANPDDQKVATQYFAAFDLCRTSLRGSISAPELVAHEYIPTLKSLLLFHARIFGALEDAPSADAKRKEAAKL